jgi:hypothetical protein
MDFERLERTIIDNPSDVLLCEAVLTQIKRNKALSDSIEDHLILSDQPELLSIINGVLNKSYNNIEDLYKIIKARKIAWEESYSFGFSKIKAENKSLSIRFINYLFENVNDDLVVGMFNTYCEIHVPIYITDKLSDTKYVLLLKYFIKDVEKIQTKEINKLHVKSLVNVKKEIASSIVFIIKTLIDAVQTEKIISFKQIHPFLTEELGTDILIDERIFNSPLSIVEDKYTHDYPCGSLRKNSKDANYEMQQIYQDFYTREAGYSRATLQYGNPVVPSFHLFKYKSSKTIGSLKLKDGSLQYEITYEAFYIKSVTVGNHDVFYNQCSSNYLLGDAIGHGLRLYIRKSKIDTSFRDFLIENSVFMYASELIKILGISTIQANGNFSYRLNNYNKFIICAGKYLRGEHNTKKTNSLTTFKVNMFNNATLNSDRAIFYTLATNNVSSISSELYNIITKTNGRETLDKTFNFLFGNDDLYKEVTIHPKTVRSYYFGSRTYEISAYTYNTPLIYETSMVKIKQLLSKIKEALVVKGETNRLNDPPSWIDFLDWSTVSIEYADTIRAFLSLT